MFGHRQKVNPASSYSSFTTARSHFHSVQLIHVAARNSTDTNWLHVAYSIIPHPSTLLMVRQTNCQLNTAQTIAQTPTILDKTNRLKRPPIHAKTAKSAHLFASFTEQIGKNMHKRSLQQDENYSVYSPAQARVRKSSCLSTCTARYYGGSGSPLLRHSDASLLSTNKRMKAIQTIQA